MICSSDVSRSGAVAIGYMLKHGVRLLEAARTLKNERHVALCNHSFIRQLVLYARSLSQLEPLSEISAHSITRTPRSRRRNDRRSMYRDYLEMISPWGASFRDGITWFGLILDRFWYPKLMSCPCLNLWSLAVLPAKIPGIISFRSVVLHSQIFIVYNCYYYLRFEKVLVFILR